MVIASKACFGSVGTLGGSFEVVEIVDDGAAFGSPGINPETVPDGDIFASSAYTGRRKFTSTATPQASGLRDPLQECVQAGFGIAVEHA